MIQKVLVTERDHDNNHWGNGWGRRNRSNVLWRWRQHDVMFSGKITLVPLFFLSFTHRHTHKWIFPQISVMAVPMKSCLIAEWWGWIGLCSGGRERRHNGVNLAAAYTLTGRNMNTDRCRPTAPPIPSPFSCLKHKKAERENKMSTNPHYFAA